MKRLTEKHSRNSLTTRMVVWVVGFVSVLFVTALFIMFHYARQSIYQEAMETTSNHCLPVCAPT